MIFTALGEKIADKEYKLGHVKLGDRQGRVVNIAMKTKSVRRLFANPELVIFLMP